MNRLIRSAKVPLAIVGLAVAGLLATLTLPHLLRDGNGSDGHGDHGNATTAHPFVFEASTRDHRGILDGTVSPDGRIQGCYTEVWPSDYSDGLGSDTERFGGDQHGGKVTLTGLGDSGAIEGTIRGGELHVDGTWGPIEATTWYGSTEQRFWGDSDPKVTCN